MIRRLSFEISYILNNTPWDTDISPKELVDFLKETQPGRALDLGCGTGTNAITMAQQGWEVGAVDVSKIAIIRAKRKARFAGVDVTFHRGDVTVLDRFEGQFDFVLDIGCYHALSIAQRTAYASNLDRLLKPDGTFLLYTWLNAVESDHSWSPTEDEIQNQFHQSMNFVQVEHGSDSSSENTSAWFTYRKRPQ